MSLKTSDIVLLKTSERSPTPFAEHVLENHLETVSKTESSIPVVRDDAVKLYHGLSGPRNHYPTQPQDQGAGALRNLTCSWGVTMCPPHLNDLALAERLVNVMRMLAILEAGTAVEVPTLTLKDVMDDSAEFMLANPESILHPHARRHARVLDWWCPT